MAKKPTTPSTKSRNSLAELAIEKLELLPSQTRVYRVSSDDLNHLQLDTLTFVGVTTTTTRSTEFGAVQTPETSVKMRLLPEDGGAEVTVDKADLGDFFLSLKCAMAWFEKRAVGKWGDF